MSRRLLLLSSSKVYGFGDEPYEWGGEYIKPFFEKSDVKTILFIPYAVKDYDEYVQRIKPPFEKLGFKVESIHEKSDPVTAVNDCKGILVGGGNTFLLLKTLYENKLVEPIRKRVLKEGVPYMGASAGSNVATRNICTTNDMPICCPPSFDALNLIPFNINPHYMESDSNRKYMGETRDMRIKEYPEQPDFSPVWETRDMRIKEYHEQPDCSPVLALKEGCCLLVEDSKATLVGFTTAKLFQKGQDPVIYQPGDDVSFLLNGTCS